MNNETIVNLKHNPGFDTEKAFYEWLKYQTDNENKYYFHNWIWQSYNRKAVFDFTVNANDILFYIDIVSYYYTKNGRLRLNTAHKNWIELFDYAKNESKDSDYSEYRLYLAFNEFVGYDLKDSFNHWNFIRIKKDLPIGDLYLGKDRNKSIRSADYIFRNKKHDNSLWLLGDRKLTKKQNDKVDNWICGNVKA